MVTSLSDMQWQKFNEQGYLRLGRLLSEDELAELQQRIDDIMLGKVKVDYDRMMMQLDAGGDDYSKIGPQTRGFKKSTLNYRKIQDLEFDPHFLAYMQRPIFRDACARTYGAQTRIMCCRAMFMNKPAGKGTYLPWHQDRWTLFDRDPKLTVWTALDSATIENGCVQIIAGSHKRGVVNPSAYSGFLTKEQTQQHCPIDGVVYLELEAGEVVLLHNYLLHSSDVNRSNVSRRAFSVCYMDANTQCSDDDNNLTNFSIVFGEGAM